MSATDSPDRSGPLTGFLPSLRPDLPLLGLGALLAALVFLIGRLPHRLEAHPEAYVPVFLLSFSVYLLSVRQIRSGAGTRRALWIILGFAVLFRLIAVLQLPSLSTDIWRYVWDGHISAQGINPYRYPPSDPALAPYRTDYWTIINHPTWVTMYPPLSQRIFALLAALGATTPYAFKAVFALFDLGTVALILLVLSRAGLPLNRALIYAWHPLVVMELSGSGHQDVLGIFFMLVAVALIRRSETPRVGLLGGFGAGLSLMAKGYLLPALPIFARKRPVLFSLALGVTVLALMLPYMGPDSQIREGMSKYLQNRLRNAGVFAWTHHLLGLFISDPLRWTRFLMTGLLGLIVLKLAWRPWKDEQDLMQRSTWAMGTFFLLSHTVYPWYATWLVPGLCMRLSPGWMLWSGLISLAYLNPVPQKNPWVPLVEYLPVLILLAWEARRHFQKSIRRRDAEAQRTPNPLRIEDR
ncbi:MAG: hypothetical protein KY468_03380 [Armatimonadetes bacterium]|nr:hypothetical protein [Armatimonadota bacterium]